MKRRLTEDEKRDIRDRQTAIEGARNPYHTVFILVNDETDEHGDPIWSVLKESDENLAIGHSPLLMSTGCKW